MSDILKFFGVEQVCITYCGEIGHPQNRAMVNVLDIRTVKWDSIKDNIPEDSIFVFVDCSYKQKNMSINHIPKIVVDHHKISTANKDILFIHDEVGACATLILELALLINVEDKSDGGSVGQCFDPDEEGTKELATALAIGIKTDTIDFLSEGTTDDDVQAFRILARYLSDEKFHQIINYEYPAYVLDYEQLAWQNKPLKFQPDFITGLGFIEDSKSDCIPTIADKFMRLQGVQTVVVYAIVGNAIRSSVRTSSSSLDCQTLCDEIFGKGYGGGKQGSGGARVPFSVFRPQDMGKENQELLWSLVKSQIEGEFLRATSK